MNVISCLIDFNESSKVAVSYAVWLSKKRNATINLVHFTEDPKDQESIKERLIAYSEIESTDVAHTCSIRSGSFLQVIPEVLKENNTDLVVIGVHGTQSSTETLSVSNVVNLIQELPISALTVTEKSAIPVPSIKEILFPMAPHNNFNIQIEETAKWAKLHSSYVDVFCLITDNKELPADIANNMENAINFFTDQNIEHRKTIKDSQVYSVGYAKDILRYAEEKNFNLIAIMSQNSEENMYFGNIEKANLLLNSMGIPILCINR